ncbi:MAG: PriCT-2 domain-containing protein, partial [Undibacterium umbellatum]|uniref:PriCT-2 domain-containing protein n=1 Tax=Undibacterium umbellatum TaxID=2762300 RepID=UPI003BB587FE
MQGDDQDRAQLVTLAQALDAVAKSSSRKKKYDGVGFAFLPGDGLIGIDIDECIDPETGEISKTAIEIIEGCKSYTEYSPSRTGLHIIVSGQTETFKDNGVGVEVFCTSQYFTFSSQLFGDSPLTIEPISDAFLERLRVIVKGEQKPKAARPLPPPPLPGGDERVRLESALAVIPSDSYDVWFRVGLALYHTMGESGFRMWDYWSSKAENYSGGAECRTKWDSFGRTHRDKPITAATIYKLAVDRGWKAPRDMAMPPKSRPRPAPPRPLTSEAEISADQGKEEELSSAAQEPQGEEVCFAGVETPEGYLAEGENAPPFDFPEYFNEPEPPQEVEEIKGLVPLAWVLSHCALIQGSTDVWDSVNKLRIKKAAFVAMVGKAAAKEWEEHKDRRSISPRNLPKIVRGVAKDTGGAGDDAMLNMLDRYTLLYGTKAVWDSVKKDIVNYDAMALARGDLALRWLTHPSRREIDHDKLVFDPTQKVDPETHINMFEGFPIKPKNDDAKVALVLRVLESLCSSEPNGTEVFEWVLKWLAYPLQHPGAKMQTALLFFGQKQGTGKSLFFEGIVKPLYGKHGATGGQNQLDSTYSFWRSKKLYVLFEEILSRQDKYSSFGLVKHLITG